MEQHRKAIESNILSERSHRYRRNILALAAVLIVMQLLWPMLETKHMGALGVTFKDKQDFFGTLALFAVAWSTLLFLVTMFLSELRTDLDRWSFYACDFQGSNPIDGFPQLRMLLGERLRKLAKKFAYTAKFAQPDDLDMKHLRGHAKDGIHPAWKFEIEDDGRAIWSAQLPTPAGAKKAPDPIRYRLPAREWRRLNSKYEQFIIYEATPPLMLTAVSAMVLICYHLAPYAFWKVAPALQSALRWTANLF